MYRYDWTTNNFLERILTTNDEYDVIGENK